MTERVVIGNAVLYHGDCLEILPSLPKVDAVITDPPYGIGFKPQTRSTKANDVYAGGAFRSEFVPIVGDEAPFDPSPILRLGVPAVLWGANNYAAMLPNSSGWLCWYKAGGIRGFHMSECELAWTNFLSSAQHYSHMWHGFKRESEVGEKVLHPTQKPVALMAWCVGLLEARDYTTILDPYMGSAPVGVVCAHLGSKHKFIGIEIERKYFDIACERIDNAQRQQRLFA